MQTCFEILDSMYRVRVGTVTSTLVDIQFIHYTCIQYKYISHTNSHTKINIILKNIYNYILCLVQHNLALLFKTILKLSE